MVSHLDPACRRLPSLATGADGTLASWDINTAPLQLSAASSAKGGEARWAAVVADPELLAEMRDYFVYAQVKEQGEDAMAPRHVPGEGAGREPEGAPSCCRQGRLAVIPYAFGVAEQGQ